MKTPTLNRVNPISMSRSLLALVAIAAATWVAGCSDDEEKKKEYVLADHTTVTGFYITPFEGGHLVAVFDLWGEKASAGLAATLGPPSNLPVGARVTLTPDDGSPPIELVGYGNTTVATGGGYSFSVGAFYDGTLQGYISTPRGNGYCRGVEGSPDSIEVYLGTFSGDTLKGRWDFVAPDTSVGTTYPNQTNFVGLAFDSAGVSRVISLDGYYVPSTTGPGYGVAISGFGPGTSNWFGHGLLSADKSSASGTSDVGDWSATRYVPPSP